MDSVDKMAARCEELTFDCPSVYEVTVPEEHRTDFELLAAYVMAPVKHIYNMGGKDTFRIAVNYNGMALIDYAFDPEELEWDLIRPIRPENSQEKQFL